MNRQNKGLWSDKLMMQPMVLWLSSKSGLLVIIQPKSSH